MGRDKEPSRSRQRSSLWLRGIAGAAAVAAGAALAGCSAEGGIFVTPKNQPSSGSETYMTGQGPIISVGSPKNRWNLGWGLAPESDGFTLPGAGASIVVRPIQPKGIDPYGYWNVVVEKDSSGIDRALISPTSNPFYCLSLPLHSSDKPPAAVLTECDKTPLTSLPVEEVGNKSEIFAPPDKKYPLTASKYYQKGVYHDAIFIRRDLVQDAHENSYWYLPTLSPSSVPQFIDRHDGDKNSTRYTVVDVVARRPEAVASPGAPVIESQGATVYEFPRQSPPPSTPPASALAA